jgi:hypothetical protein
MAQFDFVVLTAVVIFWGTWHEKRHFFPVLLVQHLSFSHLFWKVAPVAKHG